MKRVSWMPTEQNIGSTVVRRVIFSSRGIWLKKGLSVYLHTHSMQEDAYSGQLIEIAVMDDDINQVLYFEFERLMDLKFVMMNGVTIDPSLLGDRTPGRLFEVTVAHYLANKGTLTFEKDINTYDVLVSFACGRYEETYRMPADDAKKVLRISN